MSNHIHAGAANEQWRTRPADECFASVDAALDFANTIKQQSASKVIPSKALQADVLVHKTTDATGRQIERKSLVARGPSGNAAHPSHWAFGQWCARVGVPAQYMREISAPELVADCINEASARRDVEDIKVRLRQNGKLSLDAVNGPNYGLIWNANVWHAIREVIGDGVTGDYKNPALFVRNGIRKSQAVGTVTDQRDTTFYASDRDMWCMVATDRDVLKIPDRRDGKTGSLYQGFAIGNSDVGAGRIWLAGFGFDDFCYNHNIYGLVDLEEFSMRHTSSAPHRFLSEFIPTLRAMVRDRVGLKQANIDAAQRGKIADLDAFLKARKYSRSQVAGIKAAYQSDEGHALPDNDGITSASIWQATVAMTAYARGLQNAGARLDIQRDAGKMLQQAA